jgi:hypothetical protein
LAIVTACLAGVWFNVPGAIAMSGPKPDDEPVFFDEAAGAASTGGLEDPTVRPAGLTTICVLAILLGGAGFLMGCVSLTSQAFDSKLQQAVAGMQPRGNDPTAEIQRDMNARMTAVTNRYKWLLVPLAVVKIVVDAALLVGALLAWGLKPRGWSWLHGALIAAIVFEVVQAVPTLMVQREYQAITNEMMTKMMTAQRAGINPPPGMQNFMSGMTSAISIMSMVYALGWLTGKLIFYAFGIRYLRKREVVTLFAVP